MNAICIENIKDSALDNKNYRSVIYTDDGRIQLVVMCITPNDKDIPWETHENVSQIIRVESGKGKALYKKNGNLYYCRLYENSLIIIEPNTQHKIINKSKDQDLVLTSIYSPPEHPKGKIDKRKPK